MQHKQCGSAALCKQGQIGVCAFHSSAADAEIDARVTQGVEPTSAEAMATFSSIGEAARCSDQA